MTPHTVRDLLTARPFQPFRVLMSNGRAYEVRHPEMAFVTKSNLFIGIGEVTDGVPADSKICSLQQVATVEPIEGQAA